MQCKRISQKIVIKLSASLEKEFKFHPDRKILELVQYIISTENVCNLLPSFDQFLIILLQLPRAIYNDAKLKFRPVKGPSMLLDETRTLRSYRLSPTVIFQSFNHSTQNEDYVPFLFIFTIH